MEACNSPGLQQVTKMTGTFPFSLAHAQGKQGKGKCPRESACWADEAGFENTGCTPFWKPSGRSGKLQKGVSQILPLDQNRNM